jgi:hypothetical protein
MLRVDISVKLPSLSGSFSVAYYARYMCQRSIVPAFDRVGHERIVDISVRGDIPFI